MSTVSIPYLISKLKGRFVCVLISDIPYICQYVYNILMEPDNLFSILSDQTRLRALMLIQTEGEACVCEITYALDESQPKISRHLALMRESGIVESRREGTWMHYRINPRLPDWSKQVIKQVFAGLIGLSPFKDDQKQLGQMNNRPERGSA